MNSFQKLLIAINSLLIAIVITVVVMLSRSGNPASSPLGTTTDSLNVETPTLPKAQGKIMFINVDTFQAKYKFFKKIQTELDVQMNANRAELRRMETELMTILEKYKKEEFLTEQDQYNAQMDLQQREMKMREREELLTESYTKLAQKKNNDYLDKVKDYLKRKSNEHNYAYVLGYIRESNLLYAEDTLDITNLVVEGMNAEYDAANKK